MPYSHPSALALRDPPPVTAAFARPAPDLLLARSRPVAGSGSQAQNRMRDGARAATLGIRALSKPPYGGSRAS